MQELVKEINELVQSINQTTILFYQQHTQEGYQQLNDTLTRMIQTIGKITEYKAAHNDAIIDINVLNHVLDCALKALGEKDTILFSDLLQYELKGQLEEFATTI